MPAIFSIISRLRSRSRRRPATVIPPIGNAIFTASARRSGVFGVISGCARSAIDALRHAGFNHRMIAIVAAAQFDIKPAISIVARSSTPSHNRAGSRGGAEIGQIDSSRKATPALAEEKERAPGFRIRRLQKTYLDSAFTPAAADDTSARRVPKIDLRVRQAIRSELTTHLSESSESDDAERRLIPFAGPSNLSCDRGTTGSAPYSCPTSTRCCRRLAGVP